MTSSSFFEPTCPYFLYFDPPVLSNSKKPSLSRVKKCSLLQNIKREQIFLPLSPFLSLFLSLFFTESSFFSRDQPNLHIKGETRSGCFLHYKPFCASSRTIYILVYRWSCFIMEYFSNDSRPMSLQHLASNTNDKS